MALGYRFFFILPLLLLLVACGQVTATAQVVPTVTSTTRSLVLVPSSTSLSSTPTKVSVKPVPTATQEPLVPSPTPWYPIVRYVSDSPLPYDQQDNITILPVYACPKQSCMWLGDLPAGLKVEVTALNEDGKDCFVSGQTVQGWKVEGWVSCSRLSDEKLSGQ